ncbi:transmembrane and ubiquitin-like domain-containing protein 1 [Ambystoma mexicanum]|uniref:transmembrane and ubiquitin-like domain-containing protein 1 n=1 Tax=Ambystoma mexicanum TaxID=8296 RepID=UPI0037E9A865
MALIEGVGDEVTVLFGIVFCFLVLILAWVSTHTAERVEQLFVSVVPASAVGTVGNQGLETPSEPVIQPTSVQEEKNGGEEETTAASTECVADEPVPPDTPDSTSGELRQRASSTTPQTSSCPPPSDDADPVEDTNNSTEDQTMVLRLKFLNDTELLARVRPDNTVSFLKRTYFPGQEHQVRLIYQGQLLRDDAQTMSSLHLTDNCVLHCHISQHATPQMPAGARVAEQVNAALNIGSLMVPLFVLMLALLWYFQIQYRQFFTVTATVCLAGVTILFSFMAFTMYRR